MPLDDVLALAVPLLAGILYERRAATLRRKGLAVPLWRRLLVWLGLLTLVAAAAPPLHEASEDLLSAHMLQHVLLGDLAPLALAVGLTGPILRPVLQFRAAQALRVLAHPVVAFPLWIAILVVWHIPSIYDTAVENPALHALEHALFFFTGLGMWMAVAETFPGPAWFGSRVKLAFVLVLRMVVMGVGYVLFWAESPLYPVYQGAHGLTALDDQRIAAGVMLAEGSIVTAGFLCVFFLRILVESERRQALLDRGVPEPAAARAVRYGRAR